MKLPPLYEFPSTPYDRRHGPFGLPYGKFKDWARDEFQFRCVYCLHREKWVKDGWRLFQLDHVIPQRDDSSLIDSYENLVYSCGACNWTKQARALPDPCSMAYHGYYRFEPDGSVTALKDPEGSIYIEILGLDAPQLKEFRRGKFRIHRRLQELLDMFSDDPDLLNDEDLHEELAELLGYPHDIPDLRRKRVKTNTKPEGKERCYFARLERGEIDIIY